MIKTCILIDPYRSGRVVQKGVHRVAKRQRAVRNCLEMKMIRRRCTACRAVVKNGKFDIFPAEVEHIGQMVPDGLRDVLVAGDYQVLRENRKRVDLDVVFSVLSSVELDVELFRRPVFGTEEALSRRNALRVSLGSGRSHPARVELQQHRLPINGQPTRPHRLERAEIGGSHRPYRQLVPDEFAKLFHSRARSLSR